MVSILECKEQLLIILWQACYEDIQYASDGAWGIFIKKLKTTQFAYVLK